MKQFVDLDPGHAKPNNIIHSRTDADVIFGALLRVQDALANESNIVGLARHEPVAAETAGVTTATTKRTEADALAAAAAERVANDPRWKNYSPREDE